MIEDYQIYDNLDLYFPQTKQKEDDNTLFRFLYLCTVVALVGFGLVTLYSASYNEAFSNNLKGSYYVLRQTTFALSGFAIFALIQYIPIKFIRKVIFPFLLVSLVLMALTIVGPFGVEKLGARRWLQIGPLPSFQPSELLKVSTILFLAHLFSKEELTKFTKIFILAMIGIGALLILLQRDYSTTLVFLFVVLAMLLLGGFEIRYLVLAAITLALFLTIFLFLEPYRIKRVVSFIFPSIDPTGLNWQVQNSLKAVMSGNLFGKGLGNGIYKLGIIPEVHSDFIFASLAEEGGFIAIAIFSTLFALFGFSGFRVAKKLRDRKYTFESLSAFGITLMILWQAIINIMVVSALLPPTGIPLPFFSQGGTNLFVIISECGLLYLFMGLVNKESSYE
ncbi:MAG: FtsW/RodA/SpoVE family cell cycle protein [Sphaerochaetaceae bacterium]|jgi:cell division protein FtsW